MKILIIGPSWVGDSVISQSLIKVILSKSKEAKIDVLSPEWTRNIFERMDEISETITLPFSHGEMKIKERMDLGKTLKEKNYDQAIVLPNSFKSSLVPYFGEIPIRTGRRGEMRYFLINDMRILDKKIFPRMVDRFVALAFKKNENLPSSIPYPSLKVEEENLDLLRVNFGIDSILPLICLCPGAEFGPAKRWPTN
jgi:heptosyltransferase-2